jgi:hypothetical protein
MLGRAEGAKGGRSVTAHPADVDAVRAIVRDLPRSYEVLVRDQVKFRVGKIVYLAFSPDEQLLGFAFPKDQREAMLAAEPEKFVRPRPSDLRFHWLEVRLAAIDLSELTELVLDAWRMVVPKSVAAAHLGE